MLTHTLPMDHTEDSRALDGSEAIDRDAVVGVAITEAAAHDNEIIDCIVHEPLGLCIWVTFLAGTGLALKELYAEVGDHQLLLCFGTIRVLPIGKG